MTKTQSCPLSPKSSRAHRLKCPTAVLQNYGGLWYIPTGSRAQQQGADLTFTPIIPQSKTLGLTVSIADSNYKCYILKEGEDYTDSLAISSLLLLTGLGTRRASFKYSSKVLFAVQRPLSTLCWNQQVNQPWLKGIQHKAKAKAVRIITWVQPDFVKHSEQMLGHGEVSHAGQVQVHTAHKSSVSSCLVFVRFSSELTNLSQLCYYIWNYSTKP